MQAQPTILQSAAGPYPTLLPRLSSPVLSPPLAPPPEKSAALPPHSIYRLLPRLLVSKSCSKVHNRGRTTPPFPPGASSSARTLKTLRSPSNAPSPFSLLSPCSPRSLSPTMYSQQPDQDGQARQTPLLEPSPLLPPNFSPTSFAHDSTLYPEGSYAPYGWARPTALASSWEREDRWEEEKRDEMEEEGRRVSFAENLSFAQAGALPTVSLALSLPLSAPFELTLKKDSASRSVLQPRANGPLPPAAPVPVSQFLSVRPFSFSRLCLPRSPRPTLVCQPQVLSPVRRPTSSYTSSLLVPTSSRPTHAELVRLRPREQLERLLSPSYVLHSSYLRQKD